MKKLRTSQTPPTKKPKVTSSSFSFPSTVLAPMKTFLTEKLTQLKETRRSVSRGDPFKDVSRLSNNASPDSDAAEQFGHAVTSGLKEQLDRNIVEVRKALTRIKVGKYGLCDDCGKLIDTDRLTIEPEARLCTVCQRKRE
jgi:RNA polymerase-binding transcription factor DksA